MNGPNDRVRCVTPGTYAIWCPGCMTEHRFNVHDLNRDGNVLGWDGDRVRPTVAVTLEHPGCSFDLRGGTMWFHADCAHALSNRSVPLPQFPLP